MGGGRGGEAVGGTHVDDYVAFFEGCGVAGAGEGGVFVLGEETEHVDGQRLVGLGRVRMCMFRVAVGTGGTIRGSGH